MCKDEFMGDVLLISTPDGADIELDNGLIKDCRNLILRSIFLFWAVMMRI